MPSKLEQRGEARVAFTHLIAGKPAQPDAAGWAFAGSTERPHVQAWVLDISRSGMQVLAPARTPRRSRDKVYDMLLVAGNDRADRLRARVRWVWSREVAHLGQLNGFEFESLQRRATTLLADHTRRRGAARTWPICQLTEPDQPLSLWAWARRAAGRAHHAAFGAAHEAR